MPLGEELEKLWNYPLTQQCVMDLYKPEVITGGQGIIFTVQSTECVLRQTLVLSMV